MNDKIPLIYGSVGKFKVPTVEEIQPFNDCGRTVESLKEAHARLVAETQLSLKQLRGELVWKDIETCDPVADLQKFIREINYSPLEQRILDANKQNMEYQEFLKERAIDSSRDRITFLQNLLIGVPKHKQTVVQTMIDNLKEKLGIPSENIQTILCPCCNGRGVITVGKRKRIKNCPNCNGRRTVGVDLK